MAREYDGYEKIMMTVHAETNERLKVIGELVRDLAKTEVPVRSGALQKSIRMKEFPAEMAVRVYVGNNKVRTAHLVLFGTVQRRTKGSPAGWGGKKRVPHATGTTRPNNFMKRAFDAAVPQIKYYFSQKITADMK